MPLSQRVQKFLPDRIKTALKALICHGGLRTHRFSAAASLFSVSDLEHLEADEMGRALQGFGVNLLVSDALKYAENLARVLGARVIRAEKAFALIALPGSDASDYVEGHLLLQIHADFTYHQNPYFSLLPELGRRGAGVELRLFDTDPDALAQRASDDPDWTVLQAPTDKPHGLREAYLLDGHGYCWVVSTPV